MRLRPGLCTGPHRGGGLTALSRPPSWFSGAALQEARGGEERRGNAHFLQFNQCDVLHTVECEPESEVYGRSDDKAC